VSARDIADKVRNAGSPAEVEQITQGLTREQADAVVRELDGGQR
jgi:hypothetical protein